MMSHIAYLTLTLFSQKKQVVYAGWNDPAKFFKIYHILYTQKPKVACSISFHATWLFPQLNALGYVDIDQGINWGEIKFLYDVYIHFSTKSFFLLIWIKQKLKPRFSHSVNCLCSIVLIPHLYSKSSSLSQLICRKALPLACVYPLKLNVVNPQIGFGQSNSFYNI